MTDHQTAQRLLAMEDVLILTHRRPDGDTIGCACALCLALRQLGKMGEDPEDYASIWAYTHGETEPRFGLYVYPDFGFATTDRVSNLELE